jgi:hypothetical protein
LLLTKFKGTMKFINCIIAKTKTKTGGTTKMGEAIHIVGP